MTVYHRPILKVSHGRDFIELTKFFASFATALIGFGSIIAAVTTIIVVTSYLKSEHAGELIPIALRYVSFPIFFYFLAVFILILGLPFLIAGGLALADSDQSINQSLVPKKFCASITVWLITSILISVGTAFALTTLTTSWRILFPFVFSVFWLAYFPISESKEIKKLFTLTLIRKDSKSMRIAGVFIPFLGLFVYFLFITHSATTEILSARGLTAVSIVGTTLFIGCCAPNGFYWLLRLNKSALYSVVTIGVLLYILLTLLLITTNFPKLIMKEAKYGGYKTYYKILTSKHVGLDSNLEENRVKSAYVLLNVDNHLYTEDAKSANTPSCVSEAQAQKDKKNSASNDETSNTPVVTKIHPIPLNEITFYICKHGLWVKRSG